MQVSLQSSSRENAVGVEEKDSEKSCGPPTFEQLFCNQQSLWKDNNKIMREFMEFMKHRKWIF